MSSLAAPSRGSLGYLRRAEKTWFQATTPPSCGGATAGMPRLGEVLKDFGFGADANTKFRKAEARQK